MSALLLSRVLVAVWSLLLTVMLPACFVFSGRSGRSRESPVTFVCAESSAGFYDRCGCHPGDDLVATQLNRMSVSKEEGERAQECAATGVREDISGAGMGFHGAFDLCMRKDVVWDEELNHELRAAVSASQGREGFKIWMTCYRDHVLAEEQTKKAMAQLEKADKEKASLVERLEVAMKQVRQYEVQLEADRAAKKDTPALQQKLAQARKRVGVLMQDMKNFIKMLNAELARSEQETGRLRKSFGVMLKELDCRRAGHGEECREPPASRAGGAIPVPR